MIFPPESSPLPEQAFNKHQQKTQEMGSDSGERPSWFRRILNRIRLAPVPESADELEHEIQELIDDGLEHGLIPKQLENMLSSILDFRQSVAKEIMTPAADMVCVPEDAPFGAIIDTIIDKGFSRIPVYSGSIDHITGIIYAKDLLRHIQADNRPDAATLARPAFFATENRKLLDLLRDFQSRKVHLAVITDEFGGVRGIVTLEDVLEEIVGEIDDESDDSKPVWERMDDDTMIADGKVPLRDVEEFFDAELPEGPYESAAGLMLHRLGHLPGPGTTVTVNGLRMTVLAANRRRIEKIKISRISEEGE